MKKLTISKKGFVALALILAALFCVEAGGILWRRIADGDKLQVSVRIFVPDEKMPFKGVGHYDLEIHENIAFRGLTFVNPVFSYRCNSDGTGRVEIFEAADSETVYAEDSAGFNLYQWNFEISDVEQLNSFLEALDDSIDTVNAHPAVDHGIQCSFVRDSAFYTYQFESVNCFSAVAQWLYRLGDPTLMGIQGAVNEGLLSNVFPSTIVCEFAQYLNVADL